MNKQKNHFQETEQLAKVLAVLTPDSKHIVTDHILIQNIKRKLHTIVSGVFYLFLYIFVFFFFYFCSADFLMLLISFERSFIRLILLINYVVISAFHDMYL